MDKTKIEWCDSTWNPVSGCFHECPYCYARTISNRFAADENDQTHFGDKSEVEKLHILDEKVQYRCADGKFRPCAYPFGFEPTLYRYRLDIPVKWKTARTIFVCSMADLFGNWVPDNWIEEVFAACEKAPQHRYLFLTKKPTALYRPRNCRKAPDKGQYVVRNDSNNAGRAILLRRSLAHVCEYRADITGLQRRDKGNVRHVCTVGNRRSGDRKPQG